MSLSAIERLNIQKLGVGLFDAAAGAFYLPEMDWYFESSGRDYHALARLLETHPITAGAFNAVYPPSLTPQQFAFAFTSSLGLQGELEAVQFILARLAAGQSRAEAIVDALVALNETNDPRYADAKQLLANKAEVSDFYSVELMGDAQDLPTLQAVLDGVTADPASVEAAKAALNPPQPQPASPPSTAIKSVHFSADTGIADDDFVTSEAEQTIYGMLTKPLIRGERVQLSLDGGKTWVDASSKTGRAAWEAEATLLAGEHTLQVRVVNGAGVGPVNSTSYVLNFSPVFEEGNFRLINGEYGNTALATIGVSDAENDKLTYSIVKRDGDNSDLFSIDAETGILTFKNSPEPGIGRNFGIDVAVSDGRNTVIQNVYIQMPNHAPTVVKGPFNFTLDKFSIEVSDLDGDDIYVDAYGNLNIQRDGNTLDVYFSSIPSYTFPYITDGTDHAPFMAMYGQHSGYWTVGISTRSIIYISPEVDARSTLWTDQQQQWIVDARTNATGTLNGGAGDDFYFVVAPQDLARVRENPSEGYDTVQFATSGTIKATNDLEHYILAGGNDKISFNGPAAVQSGQSVDLSAGGNDIVAISLDNHTPGASSAVIVTGFGAGQSSNSDALSFFGDRPITYFATVREGKWSYGGGDVRHVKLLAGFEISPENVGDAEEVEMAILERMANVSNYQETTKLIFGIQDASGGVAFYEAKLTVETGSHYVDATSENLSVEHIATLVGVPLDSLDNYNFV